MNLSILVSALEELPLDHQRVCNIALNSFIKKAEVELEITQREFGAVDKLVKIINGDGRAPITRTNSNGTGRPIDPNSLQQRVMSSIIDIVTQNGGNMPLSEVKKLVVNSQKDFHPNAFYAAVNYLVRKGKIIKYNGILSTKI